MSYKKYMDMAEESTLKLMSFKDARLKLCDPFCCFEFHTFSTHLALSPKYIGCVSRGVRKQLDSKLTLYSEEFCGVPIAYSSARILQNNGWLLDDEPFIHCDISADYIVFRPSVGERLNGVVNKVGTGFTSCLVHGTFNASLLAVKETSDAVSAAPAVALGSIVLFEVVEVHVQRRLLTMTGRLISVTSNCSFPTTDFAGGDAANSNLLNSPSSSSHKKKVSTDMKLEASDSDDVSEEVVKKKKKKKHKRSKTDDA